MKLFKEKRNVLCELAELYLNTLEDSYFDINDGMMNSINLESIKFLLLLASTYPKEEILTIYSMDINDSLEEMKEFVDKEYKKIMKSKLDKIEKGKLILNDAQEHYNNKYVNSNQDEIEMSCINLKKIGFYI